MLSHGFRRGAGTRRWHSAPAVLLDALLHCVHKIRENLAQYYVAVRFSERGEGREGTNERAERMKAV